MASEVEVAVSANSFALGPVFERNPGVVIELQCLVPTDEEMVPYLWVRNVSGDGLDYAFDSHAAVEAVREVDSVGDDHLCRVEWVPEKDEVLNGLVETNAVLISAVGTKDEWSFEVRVNERSDTRKLLERWREAGVEAEITALHDLQPGGEKAEHELTESQREALDLALSRGYYEVPREVKLDEIAAELGISRQALSARLRRGVRNVLAMTLR